MKRWAGLFPILLFLAGCAGSLPPPGSNPNPSLYADCRGQASAAPTVILLSGAFGVAADWGAVQDDLARGGRVCAYDRAGLGRSPARSGPEDAMAIARELDRLLDQLGERGPVILAGHSNGALYAEAFAALWPARVAGLAYVQGVGDDDLDHPELVADLERERRLAGLAATLGDAGLAPGVSWALARQMKLTGDAARRKAAALSRPSSLVVARDEDRAIIPSLAEARRLGGTPASIPVAVVTGSTRPGAALNRAWHEAEIAPAARARVAWVLDAPGATHTSPLVRDRAYVTAAVNWLRTVAARGTAPD